jgi:hypothetical protein
MLYGEQLVVPNFPLLGVVQSPQRGAVGDHQQRECRARPCGRPVTKR